MIDRVSRHLQRWAPSRYDRRYVVWRVLHVAGADVGRHHVVPSAHGDEDSIAIHGLPRNWDSPGCCGPTHAISQDSIRLLWLGKALKLTWNRRARRGFFLRAEDFFGYVKRTRRTITELRADAERIESEFADLPAVEPSGRPAGAVSATNTTCPGGCWCA